MRKRRSITHNLALASRTGANDTVICGPCARGLICSSVMWSGKNGTALAEAALINAKNSNTTTTATTTTVSTATPEKFPEKCSGAAEISVVRFPSELKAMQMRAHTTRLGEELGMCLSG